MRNLTLVVSVLSVSLIAGACVGKGKYNETVDDLNVLQGQYDEQSSELAETSSERDRLQRELLETRDTLAMTQEERDMLRSQLDERMEQLERTQSLLRDTGEERAQLMERLEELSAIEREERERNRIYREFIERFQAQIEAGQLSVNITRGRVVIELPQDILFGSGSATLGEEGSGTIMSVARVLADFDDRLFQIEGHTDNVPIATSRFPSNWELSSARALSVVRLMIESGVSSESLSAAGFGEYQPAAPNDTPENRALNRRIEIVMLPNLDLFSDSPLMSDSN